MGHSVEVNQQYLDLIVELAKEVETEDPIDWGMLSIDEENAYRLIAANTLETLMPKYDQPEFREVMLATVVKLVVENFTLNLKLKGQEWS